MAAFHCRMVHGLETLFPVPSIGSRCRIIPRSKLPTTSVPNKWDQWWDACAASGGKSLLLHELEPDIKLVVSDIRESILANLDERFQQAGLRKYQKKAA